MFSHSKPGHLSLKFPDGFFGSDMPSICRDYNRRSFALAGGHLESVSNSARPGFEVRVRISVRIVRTLGKLIRPYGFGLLGRDDSKDVEVSNQEATLGRCVFPSLTLARSWSGVVAPNPKLSAIGSNPLRVVSKSSDFLIQVK
jgi:hypothetical protein